MRPGRVVRRSLPQGRLHGGVEATDGAPGARDGMAHGAPLPVLWCLALALCWAGAGTGSALAGWGGDDFIENVGQMPGGSLYYLDRAGYRIELHGRELRIWLKESEERQGRSEAQGEIPVAPALRLRGRCVRVPLARGAGEIVIEGEARRDADLRVIKGSALCRRPKVYGRLVIGSPEGTESLVLTAERDGVSYAQAAAGGAGPWAMAVEADLSDAPWSLPVATALATYTPIQAGAAEGYLVSSMLRTAEASDDLMLDAAKSSPSLLWSTFVGGEGEDYTKCVVIAEDGGVIISGCTASVDYPTTVGAYDTVFYGAYYDTYLSQLSADGTCLVWSTLLGGGDLDQAEDITLTASGDVLVVGATRSTDYPVTPGAYAEMAGDYFQAAVFVTRLTPSCDNLVWSGLMGGTNYETALCTQETESGDIVFGGLTSSSDFPVTMGAFQTAMAGDSDGFLAKLSGDGAMLLWATYLGGGSAATGYPRDWIEDLALMPDGSVVVYGATNSLDFPSSVDAYQEIGAGQGDLFVSCLGADGSTLLWSTYLGGTERENCGQMVVSPSGALTLSGTTFSTDFPITAGAFDPFPSDNCNGFVAQMAADGSRLIWSSFVGGRLQVDRYPCEAWVHGMDVDEDGTVWTGGVTDCVDLPTTLDGYDRTANGAYDGFVLALSADGSSLVWGSYLGGTADDFLRGLDVNARGRLALTSSVYSWNFPVTDGSYDTTHDYYADVAVTLFRTGPVPVFMQSFSARREGTAAMVEWRVVDDGAGVAFEVWRACAETARVLVGTVAANPTGCYSLVDEDVGSGAADYWLKVVCVADGAQTWLGPASLAAQALPSRAVVTGAWPNPFNPRATVRVSLPRAETARVGVYDLQGRLVRRLLAGELPAGETTVEWDGRDERGQACGSGAYVVRLWTPGAVDARKLVLAR